MAPKMSEYNLFVTTSDGLRTFVGDLSSHCRLTYTTESGWSLLREVNQSTTILVGSEQHGGDHGLRLDVDGLVICDSLTPVSSPNSAGEILLEPDMDW